MRCIFRIILLCVLLICQTDVFADEQIKGDTYTMKVFDGWVPGTTERIEGKIARRKIKGYDVTYTSRINLKESCSVEVLEYLNCCDGASVLQNDSLMYAKSKRYSDILWGNDAFSLRNVELQSIPERHPEPGKLESVIQKTWYIQGERNLYVITFSANDDKVYNGWLSKVESLIVTLKEFTHL